MKPEDPEKITDWKQCFVQDWAPQKAKYKSKVYMSQKNMRNINSVR